MQFILALPCVHLVINHTSAYTVFYLHSCFSKVSKNSVSRGMPVSISIDSVKNLQQSQFFTLQSSKNEMTTEKRENNKKKNDSRKKEFEFYHLLFHFQFNMLILSRSMHQINTVFYFIYQLLIYSPLFCRLFSKIFKEIILKLLFSSK